MLQGVIIDAGVSPRALKKGMTAVGLHLSSVLGVCVTHDHIDHILYADAYGEKLGLPVFATQKVHHGMVNHPRIKIKSNPCMRIIQKEVPFSVGPFSITAFEVPHDGSDNVGYAIEYEGKTLVIATDLGHISDCLAARVASAHFLVLEANYDEFMLEIGPYPYFLKERIRHDYGHLSNRATADFIAEHCHPNLSHLFLCHLSQENNHPDLALKTVSEALSNKGIRVGVDIQVHCLPRKRPSECFELS